MSTSTLQWWAAGLVATVVMALTLGLYVWVRRRALVVEDDTQAQLHRLTASTAATGGATVPSPIVGGATQRSSVGYADYLRSALMRLPMLHGRRAQQIERQLPDAIDLLVNAVRAGYSVPAAMEFVGREMAVPVGPVFQRFHDEQRLGMDMRTALEGLQARLGTPDAQMLVLALQIQRETGGNLAEVLENLGQVVRDRLDFREQVTILTAESRLSAVILAVLPVLLFFVIRLINPGYLDVMTESAVGQRMMWYAVLSLVIGTVALRHLAQIEV